MRWLDVFLFNGEEITKLRLKYLAPFVDKFFVCEQRYTFQGQRKSQLFVDLHKDWFEPYKAKVVFVVDESQPKQNAWDVESNHRNYVMPWLMAEQGPWIASICDVDEIPSTDSVEKEGDAIYNNCHKGPVYMQQMMFYYNFTWFMEVWRRAFFITDKLLLQISSLQDCRDKKDTQIGGLLQCGWHFSYFMSAAEIQRKLQSFSHTEYTGSEYTNMAHIQNCIRTGIDLFKRYPQPFQKVPLNIFPQLFQEFHDELLKLQTS